ncbi:hypothetical protein HMPREF1989_01952 [Porphyromonas gingivalis F0566]|nr:hypothetical protein HMPREF1989_01952 [Porphyromonas gingivalis F0566]
MGEVFCAVMIFPICDATVGRYNCNRITSNSFDDIIMTVSVCLVSGK